MGALLGVPPNNGLPSTKFEALAIAPTDPMTLYVGSSDAGAFTTTDGGSTWRPASSLPSAQVPALAIDPTDPMTLYAGTFFRVLQEYGRRC